MTTRNFSSSLESYGISDIGSSRSNNEDVWTCLPEIGFFALADGMGGKNAGEIAAQTTIDTLTELMSNVKDLDVMEIIIELRHAIESVNKKIHHLGSQNKEFFGMGTTLCCIMWTKDAIVHAHVGDSRIYRYRDNKLSLLTQDHSLLTKWLSSGKRAPEASQKFPYKHVITRAIGGPRKANPEMAVASFEPGDIFFLCSDGLSDVLNIPEMEKLIASEPNLELCAKLLIERAKIKGSSDNMTIVMIKT